MLYGTASFPRNMRKSTKSSLSPVLKKKKVPTANAPYSPVQTKIIADQILKEKKNAKILARWSYHHHLPKFLCNYTDDDFRRTLYLRYNDNLHYFSIAHIIFA